MKYFLCFWTLIVSPFCALADSEQDAIQLLRSWGLEYDTQGSLTYVTQHDSAAEYHPWQPDPADFSLDQEGTGTSIIKPVVIGAHSKNEEIK